MSKGQSLSPWYALDSVLSLIYSETEPCWSRLVYMRLEVLTCSLFGTATASTSGTSLKSRWLSTARCASPRFTNILQCHSLKSTKVFSVVEIVARISIFFTKLSICLSYLRYFCPPRTQRTWVFYTTWSIIVFNLLYCVALVLTVSLQCVGRPNRHGGETCVNSYAILVTASIINVLTDLAILIVPLLAVRSLQLDSRRRLGLVVVFAVGGLAVAASVARLGYQILNAGDANQTLVYTRVLLLAMAEHAIGIIVSCMPVLPSLYRHCVRRSEPESRASGGASAPGGWKTSSSSPFSRQLQHTVLSQSSKADSITGTEYHGLGAIKIDWDVYTDHSIKI